MYFGIDKIPKSSIRSRKVIFISTITLTALVSYFWFSSRYPQIIKKVSMAERVAISGIGFDTYLDPIQYNNPFLKILIITLNWYYTNWKGMAFGIAFATILMTLLNQAKLNFTKNVWINSVLGFLTGSSLGVCANCAAPIGQGAFKGGLPRESSLAIMMSSPVFNFVAISFLFSTFPAHFGVLKLSANALVILCLMPILIKYFFNKKNENQDKSFDIDTTNFDEITWRNAISMFLKTSLLNLLYIVKVTLPFMLIAGFLGSIIYYFLPHNGFSNIEPTYSTLLISSIIGTLLPVPIMFDLILSVVLLSNGMPLSICMVLLFTLGSSSIYALYITKIITNSLFTFLLFISLCGIGFIIGVITLQFEESKYASVIKSYNNIKNVSNLKHYQFATSVITKNCSIIENQDSSKECIKDEIFNYIITRSNQISDPSACSLLTDQSKREKCFISNVINEAILTKNINQCLIAFKNELAIKCQEQFFFELMSKNIWFVRRILSQPDSCKFFAQYPNLMHLCLSSIAMSEAVDRKDKSLCQNLTYNNLKEICIRKIDTMTEEADRGDKCNFNENNLSQICRSNLSVLFSQGNAQFNYCEQFISKSAKQDCQGLFVTTQTMLNRKPDGCNDFINIEDKIRCKVLWIKNENFKNIFIDNIIGETEETEISNKDPSSQINFSQNAKNSNSSMILSTQNAEVWQHQLNTRNSNKSLFSKLPASKFGIDIKPKVDIKKLFTPYSMGQGITSGYINSDIYPDIAIANKDAIEILINDGSGNFTQQTFRNTIFKNQHIFSLALVDMNNDDLSDIVFTGESNNIFFSLNTGSQFSTPQKIELDGTDSLTILSLSFYDVNKDGFLDIVAGGWPDSGSFLILNKNLVFSVSELDDKKGKTLTTLFSDINNDGYVDLFIGNDWEVPDSFFNSFLSNTSSHTALPREIKIPLTTFYTMSIDTADINNDLTLDYFASDMSFDGNLFNSPYCDYIEDIDDKKTCRTQEHILNIARKDLIEDCKYIKEYSQECAIAVLINIATMYKKPLLCSNIPETRIDLKNLCFKKSKTLPTYISRTDDIKQIARNVLLVNQNNQRLIERSTEMNVLNSSWSWNSKFADFDQDSYQDILIANGYEQVKEISSNVLFKNISGSYFKQYQEEAGISDFVQTTAFSIIDIDFDGDLDVILNGHMSSPRVYINNESSNNFIRFKIKNKNKTPIGTKIIIKYGESKNQIRELKKSGGFLSFDEETIHFGLDKDIQINEAVIVWPDLKQTRITTPLQANHLYLINRK